MFEFRRLYCEYAELHAPSSSGLDELLLPLKILNVIIFIIYNRLLLCVTD